MDDSEKRDESERLEMSQRFVEDVVSDSRHVMGVTRRLIVSTKPYLLTTDRKEGDPLTFKENLMQYIHEEQKKRRFKYRRDLLRTYVEKYDALCLVFKIYTYRKMFSVEVKRGTTTCYESHPESYDDQSLLEFLDREEVPPIVVISLSSSCDEQLFFEGGIIAQIRFYRSTVTPINELSGAMYVYLKVLTEAKVALLEMYAQAPGRSKEEIKNLEAKMIMATSGPLCLEPYPSVAIVTNHLLYEKKLLCNYELKRKTRRYSENDRAKRRALDHVQINPLTEPMQAMLSNNFFSEEPIDVPAEDEDEVEVESEVEMELADEVEWERRNEIIKKQDEIKRKTKYKLYAKAKFELKSLTKKICRIPPLERTRKDNNLVYQCEDKEEFYKELYLESLCDQDHHESEEIVVLNITKNTTDKLYRATITQSCEADSKSKSISSTFLLGFHDQMNRFVSQFIDTFTETGSKDCIIQQTGPGDESRTEFTPFMGDPFDT